jgi:6-phosphofructokinase 1
MPRISNIGVFTSGGDSPGMNAAIRAVVRTAISEGLDVFGIYRGYEGMIDGQIEKMESHSVSNIIQRGGTILKTARSKRFMTYEGRLEAFCNLEKYKINALVAIGGNGTFTGATEFEKEFKVPIVGLPGTIDNDLYGTDYTIGFDTALNTAINAADKIRDTATSHDRLFFLEVMGRDAGYIALWTGVASGAEFILVPESKTYIDNVARLLRHDMRHNKTSGIVIVSEGDDAGGAYEIARQVKERLPEIDARVTVLGHIQRGGSPTVMDRVRASWMGFESVKALVAGESGIMIGIVNNAITHIPFQDAIFKKKEFQFGGLELARILAL